MDASAVPYSNDDIARERQYYTNETRERSIPVVQEELRVGKRAVQRGGVRVYNRVREEPVEQQVNLREEHVTVDRRKTDWPATEADVRAHDEVVDRKIRLPPPTTGAPT
jgi:stress response protein YsnF